MGPTEPVAQLQNVVNNQRRRQNKEEETGVVLAQLVPNTSCVFGDADDVPADDCHPHRQGDGCQQHEVKPVAEDSSDKCPLYGGIDGQLGTTVVQIFVLPGR